MDLLIQWYGWEWYGSPAVSGSEIMMRLQRLIRAACSSESMFQGQPLPLPTRYPDLLSWHLRHAQSAAKKDRGIKR